MSVEIEIYTREKTEDDYFRDWFLSAFPYGYGTGDEHFINALKDIFNYIAQKDGKCHFQDVEEIFRPTLAWFIINKLCELDILEYGISPRYSWINPNKKTLRLYDFIKNNSSEKLLKIIEGEECGDGCYKDYCNHTNLGEKGCLLNPFFYD